MSDRLCIQSNGKVKMQLSAEDVVSCCSNCGYQCQGGYPAAAFQYWNSYGVVSGGDYLSNSVFSCKFMGFLTIILYFRAASRTGQPNLRTA